MGGGRKAKVVCVRNVNIRAAALNKAAFLESDKEMVSVSFVSVSCFLILWFHLCGQTYASSLGPWGSGCVFLFSFNTIKVGAINLLLYSKPKPEAQSCECSLYLTLYNQTLDQ